MDCRSACVISSVSKMPAVMVGTSLTKAYWLNECSEKKVLAIELDDGQVFAVKP